MDLLIVKRLLVVVVLLFASLSEATTVTVFNSQESGTITNLVLHCGTCPSYPDIWSGSSGDRGLFNGGRVSPYTDSPGQYDNLEGNDITCPDEPFELCTRGFERGFLYFDTSVIPDDVHISSVKLHFATKAANASSVVYVQKSTQHDILEVADFTAFTGTEYGHVAITNVTDGAWWTINFNAQGVADINKRGITKVGMRTQGDYLGDFSGGYVVWYDGAIGTPQEQYTSYLEITYEQETLWYNRHPTD